MTDLVTWLREQIAEDERVARDAADYSGAESWWSSVWVGDQVNTTVVITRPAEMADGGDVAVARCGVDWQGGEEFGAHIARWSPARVLAECEAKRRILDLHQPRTVTVDDYEVHAEGVVVCSTCSHPYDCVGSDEYQAWPCPTVRALTIPYQGSPGYRAEWAPEGTS